MRKRSPPNRPSSVIDPTAIPQGKLVRVRPFTSQDITDTYVGWLNDPAIVRFSNQRFARHDQASCRRYLASFADTDNLFLSVHDLADRRPVGTMTVYRNLHHGTADVGIMIGDPTTRGKGYGTDAWCTVLDWLASSGRIRKITAGTMRGNAAMIRLMERSEMELEAVRKDQELLDGHPMDLVYYARFC